MPEPVKRNQRHMPGLDELRAVAVLAVIAFHLGFGARAFPAEGESEGGDSCLVS